MENKLIKFLSSLFKEEEVIDDEEEPDSSKIKKYCNNLGIPFEYCTVDGPFVPKKCANKFLKEECCKSSITVSRNFIVLSKNKSFSCRDNPRLLFDINPTNHQISLKVWLCEQKYYDFEVISIDDYIITNSLDSQKIKEMILRRPLTLQELKSCKMFNKQSA